MKNLSFIISILFCIFCYAQQNPTTFRERKVENSNEFAKDVKLIYNFEYHLLLPKRIFLYENFPEITDYSRLFSQRSDNGSQGFNYIYIAPGPKPLRYTPKIVIDGVKY